MVVQRNGQIKSEEKNKSSDNTNPYNAKPWAWCHVNRKSKHRLLQELHMMWSSNYKGQWKKEIFKFKLDNISPISSHAEITYDQGYDV